MNADVTVRPKPDRRRLLPLLQLTPVTCPLCGGIETTWAAHEAAMRFHCNSCRQALAADEFMEKSCEAEQVQREQQRAWEKVRALLTGHAEHSYRVEQ
jgi:hypothetical protein